MKGYVDLHSHYIPAVDDGVSTLQDGVALVRGLHSIGFDTVIATPHIRSGMFENRKAGLLQSFQDLVGAVAELPLLPQLGLAAEHFCDDMFWDLFVQGEALPYPGGHALLFEFPTDRWPLNVEQRVFQMNVRGVRPVLAHPERYDRLATSSAPIERMLEMEVLLLLDVMTLTGKHGRRPRRAAERMLEEGLYFAACSDCHRPADVEVCATAIERLRELMGADECERLLSEHPRQILDGLLP